MRNPSPRTYLSFGAMLALLCACSKTPEHTEVSVTRRVAASCVDSGGSDASVMNAYLVELYQLTSAGQDEVTCADCFKGHTRCAIVDRTCVCGDEREAGAKAITEALSGTRLTTDRPELAHCIRVAGLVLEPLAHADCVCPDSLLPDLPNDPSGLPDGGTTDLRIGPITDSGLPLPPDGGLDGGGGASEGGNGFVLPSACAMTNDPAAAPFAQAVELELYCQGDWRATGGSPASDPWGRCLGTP